MTTLTERMSQLNLQQGVPQMVAPSAPGSLGREIRVQTNVFGVGLEKEQTFHRYDVMIHAEGKSGKPIYFTKKGRDDALVLDRAEKCVAVFKYAVQKEPSFFKKDVHHFFYDGQSILFVDFDLFEGTGQKGKSVVVDGPGIGIEDLADFSQIVLDIQICERNPLFVLDSVNMKEKTANAVLSDNDHTIAQFMDLAINQEAIMNPQSFMTFENGKVFMKQPGNHRYAPRDCPDVGDKKTLGVGIQKSVKFIEGPRGRGVNNPSVVVDAKKAAFHDAVDLLTKANAITGESFTSEVRPDSLAKMNQVMKELFFVTKHQKKQKKYMIGALVPETPAKTTFALPDGTKTTVQEYFQSKYNITLKFPNTPLVRTRGLGAKETHFPMEVCILLPFQRVTIPQQTPVQSQKTTKECAIPPAARQRNIMLGATAIGMLNAENEYIRNAGLKIFNVPIAVSGREMPPPELAYGGAMERSQGGKWRLPRGGQYVVPASCPMWGLYVVFDSRGGGGFGEQDLKSFAQVFVAECNRRGMKIGAPADIDAVKEANIRMKLEACARHGCRFAFFVTADGITSLHKALKLYERELGVVTQDMKLSNCTKVVREKKFQTLENVVLKTNLKLGGHNHSIVMKALDPTNKMLNPKRLIIGIAFSNPPPGAKFEAEKTGATVPIVVGFAANWKGQVDEFIGDFAFQAHIKDQNSDTMSYVLRECILKYSDAHDKTIPDEIIVYRAGLAEGLYEQALKFEVPLIRHLLQQSRPANPPKLVLLNVQKEHNTRLFKTQINAEDRPPAQNIPSGIVVDTQITNPSYKEFYLNAHNTLQGSARTPRYTVIADDLQMKMDEIEALTYALCFGHQIVTSATSVPTPLYVANRYAERGRMLLGADILLNGGSESSSEGGPSTEMEKLTTRLGYAKTALANVRINA